jgi:hypothetical protein
MRLKRAQIALLKRNGVNPVHYTYAGALDMLNRILSRKQKVAVRPSSILKDWVTELGLRHQGVLITALRGCDGALKQDCTKQLQRELRGLILNPFDEREMLYDGFMIHCPNAAVDQQFILLLKSLDHYPVHYLFHFIHALEIIGYCHPVIDVRNRYYYFYSALVKKLHLRPETKQDMELRLGEDRIANKTVLE